jgi:ketosteroid isomerase-like protein
MLLTAALALTLLVPGPAPSREDQVVEAERAWSQAFLRHDLAALSRLLADDFVGIDGRGFLSDKAAELEEARAPEPGATGPALAGEALSEVRVRLYGDTAILTAVNTARFSPGPGETAESTIRYRRTTVWVWREGRWQCVSFHGSRIQEPRT